MPPRSGRTGSASVKRVIMPSFPGASRRSLHPVRCGCWRRPRWPRATLAPPGVIRRNRTQAGCQLRVRPPDRRAPPAGAAGSADGRPRRVPKNPRSPGPDRRNNPQPRARARAGGESGRGRGPPGRPAGAPGACRFFRTGWGPLTAQLTGFRHPRGHAAGSASQPLAELGSCTRAEGARSGTAVAFGFRPRQVRGRVPPDSPHTLPRPNRPLHGDPSHGTSVDHRRRQRSDRVGRSPHERGDRDLPDHPVVEHGRVRGRVVRQRPQEHLGHDSPGDRDAVGGRRVGRGARRAAGGRADDDVHGDRRACS